MTDSPPDAPTGNTGTATPLGARWAAALADRGPLCAGIDPHPGLLRDWGLPVDAGGLERFALGATEAIAPHVAVVKPQSAFYESFGSAGIAVLEKVVAAARDAGALVLLDVKRGDIGSTMQAYAQAYLADGAPLAVDAITVSPFLGLGSLEPAIELARRTGRGLFVLCRTSNPESGDVQQATAGGRSVAQRIVDEVAALNAGASPLGSFGLVVGATLDTLDVDLSALHGPVLAPGLGAQGGDAAAVRRLFGAVLPAVSPSSSREILAAGPDPAALREAVERQQDALRG